MEFKLKDSIKGKLYISNSDYNEIRYFNVPQVEFEDEKGKIPQLDFEEWKISSPENSGDFSAVAYHFAKNLHNDLNVPIGTINCNKGGTSASCWLSEKYLSEDEELKNAYLDTYYNIIENLNDDEADKMTAEFLKSQEDYVKKEEQYKKLYPERGAEEVRRDIGLYPWPPPVNRKAYGRPNGLYNTMLKKVIPYRVKGVIWYQGEEDSQKPHLYRKLFKKLIENWREAFRNENLPFSFVQLPMFDDDRPESWAIVRDAQLSTFRNVKNTSMIVAADCGEEKDVHPRGKKPIGERLAIITLEDVYKKSVKGHSPMYSGYEIKDNKIIISFDYIKDGELCTIDGSPLKGFEICAQDKKYVEAQAEIAGDKVIVWNEKVANPVAVRYGWKNYIEVNLCNENKLPAATFNTEINYYNINK
jgi:sialate O-acetylesterase